MDTAEIDIEDFCRRLENGATPNGEEKELLKDIAMDYHGGQTCPLYEFGSSGVLDPDMREEALGVISDCAHEINQGSGDIDGLIQLKLLRLYIANA